jgi:hypothetical protein
LNIALRIFEEADDMSDEAWFEKITAFVVEQREPSGRRGVRRVSIVICRRGQYPVYPVYFTLRESDVAWGEDQAIRNVEPALPFQLELSQLSNYNLTPCFVEAKQTHMRISNTKNPRSLTSVISRSLYRHSCRTMNMLKTTKSDGKNLRVLRLRTDRGKQQHP